MTGSPPRLPGQQESPFNTQPMDRRSFVSGLATVAAFPASSLSALARTFPAAGEVHALVLGTAQDAGFPQIGCYTDRCNYGRELWAEGRPRFVSSIALIEPDAQRFYLVDATPDITHQIDLIDDDGFRRRAAERRPFDGIFLTHAHIGHYSGLDVLGNEGIGMAETPLFCTPRMAEFISSNQPWRFLVDQGRLVPTPIPFDTWHRLDDNLEVQLWKVPHRDEFADTVGFVFRGPSRTLLFLPDINGWHLWDKDAAEAVASVDVALLDASFWSMDEMPGRSMDDVPHPLILQTMDTFQSVVDDRLAEVVLTHINNSNPALDDGGPQQAEIARRGFTLAREGMRFEL